MNRVSQWRTTDGSVSTRERILREASLLIAQRGYHATTTRQIAQHVGIQQPSLFHHFASKAEIVNALLAWDLGQTLPIAKELSSRRTSAPVRLYEYLSFDIDHLMTSPYNLAGIYAEDVISDPAFATWASQRDEVHACVERIVANGVEDGDFMPVNPRLIQETIAGVLVGVLTFHSGGRQVELDLSDEITSLLLRGLLAAPQTLEPIRQAAREWA
jgi:AcrR family transcriptional regulator